MNRRFSQWLFLSGILLFLFFLLIFLTRNETPRSLDHDAYVWQYRWSTPVKAALHDSADLVRAWRILAGEVDAQGRFRKIAVDLDAVAASGRQAIPVIRIEAPLARVDTIGLISEILSLQRDWQAVTQAGLEIDHDCATRQLTDYADWLRVLRRSMKAGQTLSITLLPDWLSTPDLDHLLDSVDETVLQLHAVDNPAGVLFDPASARSWTAALAARTSKPFRVALPDYGSLVRRDEKGRITAIESEQPTISDQDGVELFAAPESVSGFLRHIESNPPRSLAGVVWFRLPVSGDQRAWTPGTWRAVIKNQKLTVRLLGEIRQDPASATSTLFLRNIGETDTVLPAAVIAAAPCRGRQGMSGYSLEEQGDDSAFLRTRKALFRAGSELPVGSLECPAGSDVIRIEP